MCTNYTAHKYKCLSVTLEMPFKDNANFPNLDTGWNGDRSADLGASAIDAIFGIISESLLLKCALSFILVLRKLWIVKLEPLQRIKL